MLEALLNLDASLLLAIQDLRLDWLDPIVAFYLSLIHISTPPPGRGRWSLSPGFSAGVLSPAFCSAAG